MSSIKDTIRSTYGINRLVTGEYDPSVSASCGNGVFIGKKSGDVISFKGIPFACPPVGRLRWKAPLPCPDSAEIREAFYNGKSPIQTEWKTEVASYYPQGEDCLYLNVWKNSADTSEKKAVMVFFHGGSYGWGGTADPLYDGENFVRRHPDIILITVGYRVGLMGFVDLSCFTGGEKYPDAPNLGLLDQIEALRWINRNARAFGGDRKNVTIFGESAGGGSVSLLPIIPQAKGLFKRVIAESGSVALTFSKEECRDFSVRLMKESKTKTMEGLLKLSEDSLMEINKKLNYYNNFPQRDGRLIPSDPYEPYRSGATADVDILIGTNSDEANYWVGEIGGLIPFRFSIPVKFENDLRVLTKDDKQRVKQFLKLQSGHSMWRMAEFYDEMMFRLPAIEQASQHSKNGGKAYMYYWTHPSAIPYRGACHAVELAYVFGNLDESIFTGERADEQLSQAVTEMWTNFAKTGDPSVEGIKWEEYSCENRATMIFEKTPHMESDVLSEQRELLYPLLRHMITASYATLDYNVPFVRKLIAGGIGAAAAIAATVFMIKKVLEE